MCQRHLRACVDVFCVWTCVCLRVHMCGVSVSCLDACECMGVGLRVNVLDACMYVLIYVGACVIVYALPRERM